MDKSFSFREDDRYLIELEDDDDERFISSLREIIIREVSPDKKYVKFCVEHLVETQWLETPELVDIIICTLPLSRDVI